MPNGRKRHRAKIKTHKRKKHRKKMKLAPEALAKLRAYDWPGNVRQLNAVLMRSYVWETGNIITAAGVQEAMMGSGRAGSSQYLTENLDDTIARLGKELIDRALTSTGGKKAPAARQLGLSSPQTLNNRYGAYQRRLAKH